MWRQFLAIKIWFIYNICKPDISMMRQFQKSKVPVGMFRRFLVPWIHGERWCECHYEYSYPLLLSVQRVFVAVGSYWKRCFLWSFGIILLRLSWCISKLRDMFLKISRWSRHIFDVSKWFRNDFKSSNRKGTLLESSEMISMSVELRENVSVINFVIWSRCNIRCCAIAVLCA